MASSKYLLGELITQRREKNPGGGLPIRGVSKAGLQPPKQIDADTSIYNLYYRNDFVYNPARMELGSIAFNDEYDRAICSSLYEVFYVHRTDLVIPEYLALFVKHPEFARYCNYIGNGSAREYCRFDNISGIPIFLPSIDEQRKIVHDYRIVVKRICLLHRMNSIYFEAIETLFNTWIVEHLFVDKSKGMLSTTYGEIPVGWKYTKLGELCDVVTKGTTPTTFDMSYTHEGVNFIKVECINDDHSFNEFLFTHIDSDTDEFLKRSRIQENDILFTIAGTLGKFAMAEKTMLPANTNQAIAIIRVNLEKFTPGLLYTYFVGGWQTEFYKRNTQQAVQANLSLETIKELPLPVPDADYLVKYESVVHPFLVAIRKNHREIQLLELLEKLMVAYNVMGG